MAGHVHDVGRYAPEGFKLLVSNYEGGKVTHVFGMGDTRLECVVGPHEDEEAALAAFQARHAPTVPAPAAVAAEVKAIGENVAEKLGSMATALKPRTKRLDK